MDRSESDGKETRLTHADGANMAVGRTAYKPDPHDGHGAYLTEAREPRVKSLEVATAWVGLLVAVTFARWALVATIGSGEIDASAVLVAILGLVFSWIGFRYFVSFLLRTSEKQNALRIGVGIFVLALVVPLAVNQYRLAEIRVATLLQAEQDASQQRVAMFVASARRWRADVDTADAHGALGVEPPMLEVTDYGAEVAIRNISGAPLCIKVSRVLIDTGSGKVSARCEMVAKTPSIRCPGMSDLLENEKHEVKFFLPHDAKSSCAHQPLAYQIGGQAVNGPTWWSDTDLEDFDSNLRKQESSLHRTPRAVP